MLSREMDSIACFKTGVEDLDKHLRQPIASDEIVEVCGASGSGKTYLCLKMASLALLDNNIAVIYIDTTNYLNHENMSLVLSNFITETTDQNMRAKRVQQALSRLRVIKVFALEELFLLLSMILTQIKRR
mmetsp:Transcript_15847/g.19957  ORF Transcript_15847/g.19957 Transcript_15847/m.19957 type:complete len:130 (+) Transcript_15847:196-585(+)